MKMKRRQLFPLEIAEARLVFDNNLSYEKVHLIEEIAWSNWVGRLGALLSRKRPPTNNAVTIGNKIWVH